VVQNYKIYLNPNCFSILILSFIAGIRPPSLPQ
jgi:hypothetical protein